MSVERRSGRRQEWLVVKTNDEKETGRCWSARLGGGEGKTSHFCFREEILVMSPALVEPGGKGLQNLTEKLVSHAFQRYNHPSTYISKSVTDPSTLAIRQHSKR